MSDDGADAFLQLLGESLKKGEFGKKPEPQVQQTDKTLPAETLYPCQYCGESFSKKGLKAHEKRCDSNPANQVSAEPVEPSLTKEKFDDFLKNSSVLKQIVQEASDRLISEKIKKIDIDKMLSDDDRIKAAIQIASASDSINIFDWPTMFESLKAELLNSIKSVGEVPLYYRNNPQVLADIIRMFPYKQWETYDPALTKWLQETSTREKRYGGVDPAIQKPDFSHRSGKMRNTSAETKRHFELFLHIMNQHHKASVVKELNDLVKKVAEAVLQYVGKPDFPNS